MKKREPLRIRLVETKTVKEIEAMIQVICNDPDSKIGAFGGNIYNKSASKKIDEMGWAIYTLTKRSRAKQYKGN